MKKYLSLFGVLLALLAALSFGTLIGCSNSPGGGVDDDDDGEVIIISLGKDLEDVSKGIITSLSFMTIMDADAESYLEIEFDFTKSIQAGEENGWEENWAFIEDQGGGDGWGKFGDIGIKDGDDMSLILLMRTAS